MSRAYRCVSSSHAGSRVHFPKNILLVTFKRMSDALTAQAFGQYLSKMARHPKTLYASDFDKIKIGENVSTRGGAKFYPITHEDGSQVLLDYGYSILTTPFRPRAFAEETKVNFLLSLPENMQAYVEQLSDRLKTLCKSHAGISGNLSAEVLEKKFTEPFRRDETHSPLLRTKIETGEIAQVKIWSPEGLRVSFENGIEQLQGGNFKARIKLKGLWMQSDKSHGLSLSVDDIMLQPCEEAEEECPFPCAKKARAE